MGVWIFIFAVFLLYQIIFRIYLKKSGWKSWEKGSAKYQLLRTQMFFTNLLIPACIVVIFVLFRNPSVPMRMCALFGGILAAWLIAYLLVFLEKRHLSGR